MKRLIFSVFLGCALTGECFTYLPTDTLEGNSLVFANYLNSNNTVSSLEPVLEALGALSSDELAAALQSAAPTRNAIETFSSQNTMFTFCNALYSRLSSQRALRQIHLDRPILVNLPSDLPFDELLAMSSDDQILPAGSSLKAEKQTSCHAIWLDGFGEFSRQNAQNQVPSFHLFSGGALLGVDYFCYANGQIGGAIGYAKNSIHEDQNSGSGSINFYTASIYGIGYIDDGYIQGGLWGSYNKYKNHRHIDFPGFDSTANNKHEGIQLTPYLGGGYDFLIGMAVLEPFVALDWVVDFQNGYRENNASPLNMRVPGSTSSMLRSEIGLNAYETWQGDWGVCVLRETASYLNKAPFSTGTTTAAIIGASGNFTVKTFTTTQNLFSPSVELFFRGKRGAFVSLFYEGEFGGGYMTNQILLRIGQYF